MTAFQFVNVAMVIGAEKALDVARILRPVPSFKDIDSEAQDIACGFDPETDFGVRMHLLNMAIADWARKKQDEHD